MSRRPDVIADTRWIGPHGIGRFAAEVLRRIPGIEPLATRLPLLHPLEPFLLSAALRRSRPRLYFTPGFNPPSRSPVPVVMALYDLIHLQVREETSWRKRLYYTHVVRPAAARGAGILTPSEFTRREILAWARVPEARVHVVGAGVSAAFHPAGPRHAPGYPYLLYIGNHKPHKNLPGLVAAFAMLPRDWGMHLLVSGALDAPLAALARRFGVFERVIPLGNIPEAELPAYYRGARLFVSASLYEGFGLPMLEAMACGIPVVAFAVTAIPEVCGAAAHLVEPAHRAALAAGMRAVLEDTAVHDRLVAAGAAQAQRFDWDAVAARVRAVLETV